MNRASVENLPFLLFGVVLIALAPLLALTFFTASDNRAEEGIEFEQEALQFAEIVSLQERAMMERGRSILLSMSEAAEIRSVTGTRQGAPKAEDVRRADEYLARQLRLHPEYLNLGFADTTGRVWCSALALPDVVNISDREYFRRAIEVKGFGVGVYQVGRITRKPAVNLGQAVLDSHGDVAGVIYLASDLRITDQISRPMRLLRSDAVIVSLLDRNGVVLARHPGEVPGVGTRTPEFSLIEEGLTQERGIARGADSTGTRYLYAFSRVAGGVRSGDAYVLLSFPEEDAFHAINSELRHFLFALAAVAALAIALSYLGISVLVLHPVQSLLHATARLAAGDLSTRAGPPYRGGEVGRLSIAFDRMAIALQANQAERNHAEAALRVSEENYRSLVNEAPYGILRTQADGRILDANPALVKMLGYESEDDLKRMNAREFYGDPDERAGLLEKLSEASGSVTLSGVRLKCRNGGFVHVHLVGRSVRRRDGVLLHIDSLIEDESERHKLEVQLQQAQKMEAVGRLASGVAHDFNNLLGVILGHSDLVLQSLGPDDPNADALRQVRDAAARGAALTRQLLGFSRVQASQPTVMDINVSIGRLRSLLDRLIGENYTLRVEAGSGLPQVRVDPIHVEQIVMNLVVNARDSMPEAGDIILAMEAVRISEPTHVVGGDMPAGEYVCLKVRDRGVGIAPEVRPHIFEPFFTTKATPGGTGLGLAIVLRIVKQSEGYVRVQSEVGMGTVVEVFLPACYEAPSPVPPRPAESGMRGTETILLVEDEEGLQELLSMVLSRAGYRVVSARSGQEALALTDHDIDDIHLVVTDVIMPGMGGGELADRLQAHRPGLKVLFISGYPNEPFGTTSSRRPDAAFLSKPFTADELLRKVRETLDRGGA